MGRINVPSIVVGRPTKEKRKRLTTDVSEHRLIPGTPHISLGRFLSLQYEND